MALADYDAYLAALRANRGADFQLSAATGRAARLSALWRTFVPAPVVPTTSVALDGSSDIAIGPLPPVDAGKLTLLGARINPGGIGGVSLIVADILNHSGGLVADVATEQTTNLPTAALTRYTSGVGVMAGLLVTTAIGTTATTFTFSYTNQAGTAGRISQPVVIGSTAVGNAIGTFAPICLADGDTGVRSVESVTLAATTGAPGVMGVVLFKPLAMIALNDFSGAHVVDAVSSGGFVGAFAQCEPDACVSLLAFQNVAQGLTGSILLAEA
jgi:hypothetical protein